MSKPMETKPPPTNAPGIHTAKCRMGRCTTTDNGVVLCLHTEGCSMYDLLSATGGAKDGAK